MQQIVRSRELLSDSSFRSRQKNVTRLSLLACTSAQLACAGNGAFVEVFLKEARPSHNLQ